MIKKITTVTTPKRRFSDESGDLGILHVAASKGFPAMLSLLLENSADPNQHAGGFQPPPPPPPRPYPTPQAPNYGRVLRLAIREGATAFVPEC